MLEKLGGIACVHETVLTSVVPASTFGSVSPLKEMANSPLVALNNVESTVNSKKNMRGGGGGAETAKRLGEG